MSYRFDGPSDVLTAHTTDHDGVAVVALTGEVDMLTEGIGLDEVLAAVEKSPAALVVDLQAVGFFGSSGINLLLVARREAEARKIPLAVVAEHHVVLSPLAATGVDLRLRLFPDLAAALRDVEFPLRAESPTS
ncbi:STAS domain-containing protein [Lentzea sp. NPDC058436]|uniref:STAS domain-containing protein n=1 Tax=Lentzea sp. NPDC058436 TaxID=3346499 RepID=UPI00365B5DB9